MRCVKRVLELGKCLYEFPSALARHGGTLGPHAQIADKTREEMFNLPHRLERDVCDRVSEARHRVTSLISRKCGKIDMRDNELDLLDVLVEPGALCGEKPHAPARLVPRERDEPCEKRERESERDEVRHGVNASRGA